MKPANFDYYAPSSLEEALNLLQQYGDDAKILAGGQSLMPLMNMRLARPSVVIDINRVSELEHISLSDDGGLSIGALTRERAVELSDLVQERTPLLSARHALHWALPDSQSRHHRGQHCSRRPGGGSCLP